MQTEALFCRIVLKFWKISTSVKTKGLKNILEGFIKIGKDFSSSLIKLLFSFPCSANAIIDVSNGPSNSVMLDSCTLIAYPL